MTEQMPELSPSPTMRQMQLDTLMAELRQVKAIAADESMSDEARAQARAEVARLGQEVAKAQTTTRYFG